MPTTFREAPSPMNVILLTVFFSLLLATAFILLFLHDRQSRGKGSVEADALRPLDEETPIPADRAKR